MVMMASSNFKLATIIALINFISIFTNTNSLQCVPRSFGKSSIVCVCNVTYCDTQEPLSSVEINRGEFYHVVSTELGKRFDSKIVTVKDLQQRKAKANGNSKAPAVRLLIERNVKYQSINGFGGAFTDAGGINLLNMPENLRNFIMNGYFGDEGLEYTIQRVPIGGTDFSDRNYTLCDRQGPTGNELEYFALQEDDLKYKIPFIEQAREIQPNLSLFASPWSAPAWMKTNTNIVSGQLKPEYYQLWAEYFVKFFEAYEEAGVDFWGLTPQNEPEHGLIIPGEWNSMGWSPQNQKEFIKNNLGPSLNNSGFDHLKMMINDGQRFQVQQFSRTILRDPEAAKFVSGIALHWYSNFYFGPGVLNKVHDEFPDYFMINTEACTGYLHFFPGIDPVVLGSWERAEYYAHNIIEDLNHWLTGWVEWNLVLDTTGGPNWAGNQVDSPVIFDKSVNEAYKQPMYYALGHFTKYIPKGSVRIFNSGGMNLAKLQTLTVLRPDGKIVAVVFNPTRDTIPLDIYDTEYGKDVRVEIEPKSINTFIYSDLSSESDGSDDNSAMCLSQLNIMYILAMIVIFLFK